MKEKVIKVCRKCGRVLKGKSWVFIPRENFPLDRRIVYTICKFCARHPMYYEALVQVDESAFQLFSELSKDANFYEAEDGFRFRSKKEAERIARKAKEAGALVKRSFKVAGFDRQRSKPLLRDTFHISFPFKALDVVEFEGKEYLVKKPKGKYVLTYDNRLLPVERLKKVPSEVQHGFFISRRPPILFIKETNETIEVETFKEGEVKVIRTRKNLWVIE